MVFKKKYQFFPNSPKWKLPNDNPAWNNLASKGKMSIYMQILNGELLAL